MIRNTASQTISASLVSRTDGSAVTSGTTTVYVTKDAGTQATGAGTVTHEGNGEWSYVPTQGETDAVHVAFTFTNSTAVQATVNVYTRPSGTGFPAVDASNRVDLGKLMGVVLTTSGNVVTFPLGISIVPTTTSTVAVNIKGGAAATGMVIAGGNYDSIPDVTGTGLTISAGNDSGNAGDHRGLRVLKGSANTEGVLVTGNINAVLDTVTTTTTATNLTNLPTIPSNWLTAAGIAASALNGKGDWNVGKTGYALTATTGLGNQTANITGTITTATNVTTVNGLAANVITAAATAADFGTEVGTAVWATTTRVLTAGTNIALAKGTGVTGFNDLSAAQVNTEVDTALTDIHLDHLLAADYDPAAKPGVSTALLNELVESNAGVSRYTAAALAQAPSGGGGTADWTADERTAIKAILGVPGSGTTPVTPTTGMLDTINDNIASLSAGSGSGAFVVAITVTDGTNPLQNAIVRLTEGANTYRATTNVSGVATFSLDAATYTRSITKGGYTFTPNTLAVSGATTSTSAMTATTIPPPSDPDGCTVTIRARTQQLVAQAGVTIGFRYISLPAGSGMALPVNPLLITTDSNGDATAELLQGATIKFWRGKEPALANTANTFTVPAASTYELPDLLGEDAT
jgi:hypothetical protein